MIAEKLYLKPISITEAMKYAAEHQNDFRFLAGGTDVIVNKFQKNDNSSCLIDLTGIEELKQITSEENFLKIGSLVRLDDLKRNKLVRESFPALLQAAHAVASPLLRKTATLGGNLLCENRCTFYNQSEWWREAVGYCLKCDGDICIATGGKKACFSKFVSDTAPVLISMLAQIEIAEGEEINTVPLETIYTGDGVNSIHLPKTAIIRYILLPLDKNFKTVFKKLRPRQAVDFTSLTTAVSICDKGTIRIVIGGVDPKPVLIEGNINEDISDLIKKAMKKPRVVDNDFYSRTYRREMMEVFLQQSFKELIK